MRNFALLLLLSSLAFNAMASNQSYEINNIASGLDHPWALEFLPNGDILVTERAGKISVVRKGKQELGTVKGIPEVYFAGQGGLMDIMLDRDFNTNRRLYLSLAYGDRDANAVRLMSVTLVKADNGYTLANHKVLFTASPLKRTAHHYGARLAQLHDGSLVMTVGDGFNYREQAQTLDNHLGKIIRVNADGSVPKDNPFQNTPNAQPEIYSIGHRNQQALALAHGRLYENEHGPQGGDEINVILPGQNYGWPVATNGIDYNGARISPFTDYDGMRAPMIDWTPSIAPSSMTFHKGSLYVTALAEKSIRRIDFVGDDLADAGIVFERLNTRLRDIASGPDGHLYVLTDGDNARLVRIEFPSH